MARVTTLVLRIAWANRQHNARLAIAANILVNAGILLIYILNVVLSQRVLRAKQPLVGWHPIPRVGTRISYALIPGALIMSIVSVVVQLYSENQSVRSSCRDVQLALQSGCQLESPATALQPAWYHSKACFYILNFMLEILILCLLTFSRIDKRFYIPNGSTKHGDYSRTKLEGSDSMPMK
uniref:Uncharacterized protein n=1 Tax=Fusarium oxysporum (strain Fo5176) TaxID=660025 RepID=A0A0C4DJA1_FUSOF